MALMLREAVRTALLERGAPADVADSLAARIEDLAREVSFPGASCWPELADLGIDQAVSIVARFEREAATIVKRITMSLMVEVVSLEQQLRRARQSQR